MSNDQTPLTNPEEPNPYHTPAQLTAWATSSSGDVSHLAMGLIFLAIAAGCFALPIGVAFLVLSTPIFVRHFQRRFQANHDTRFIARLADCFIGCIGKFGVGLAITSATLGTFFGTCLTTGVAGLGIGSLTANRESSEQQFWAGHNGFTLGCLLGIILGLTASTRALLILRQLGNDLPPESKSGP